MGDEKDKELTGDQVFIITIAKDIFMKAFDSKPSMFESGDGKTSFLEIGNQFNILVKELYQGLKELKN